MLQCNISKLSVKKLGVLKWVLKKENIFKSIYLNLVFREAVDHYAVHTVKGTLNIDVLVEEHLQCEK